MLGQDTAIVGANLAATRWVAVVFQGGKRQASRRLCEIQFELKLFLEGLALEKVGLVQGSKEIAEGQGYLGAAMV